MLHFLKKDHGLNTIETKRMSFILSALGFSSNDGTLGKHSTALDVVQSFGEGEYLKGKVAIVTGGNSGIGLETCKVLAFAGCRVIMCSRSISAGENAINEEIMNDGHGGYKLSSEQRHLISVQQLDLNSLANVKKFCNSVKECNVQVDFLFLNAGIMALPEREETEDGFEKQIGVNHMAHAFLVNELYDKITTDAVNRKATDVRFVVLSSTAHRMGSVVLDDLHYLKGRSYAKWEAYGQSKLCNLLFAKGLATKLDQDGFKNVTAMSVHPGVIKTGLWKETPLSSGILNWLSDKILMDKTIPQGAATSVFAALSPRAGMADYRGAYLVDCAATKPLVEAAENQVLVQGLWDETRRQLAEKLKELKAAK